MESADAAMAAVDAERMSADCDQRAHRFGRPADGAGAGRRPRPCDPLRRPGPAGGRRRVAVRGTAGAGQDHTDQWSIAVRGSCARRLGRGICGKLSRRLSGPGAALSRSVTGRWHSTMSSRAAAAVTFGWPPFGLSWRTAAWRSFRTAPNSPIRDIWFTQRGPTKPSSIRSERLARGRRRAGVTGRATPLRPAVSSGRCSTRTTLISRSLPSRSGQLMHAPSARP